jgi:hypothetical protein
VDIQDLKDANLQVAQAVLDAARPPRRTGRLAASERAAGTQAAAIVRAGGARVPYAGPIHWGWPLRNIAAQPWIQEAAESTEGRWLATYQHHIDTIIRAIEEVTP